MENLKDKSNQGGDRKEQQLLDDEQKEPMFEFDNKIELEDNN